MTYQLHSLLRGVDLPIPCNLANPLVLGLTCDSRYVKEGNLFLGIPGQRIDGGVFWRDAIAKGCVAALISASAAKTDNPCSEDPVAILPDPVTRWIGEIASFYWNKPSSRMALLGVTGTNGKTTTTYLIEHLCAALGKPTILLGTLVNRWPGFSQTAIHTTNFADQLQENLSRSLQAGVEFGVMEVSSHALDQNRVSGCNFSGAVFTNLTQDHLDYHVSMEEYFAVKSKLFFPPYLLPGDSRAIINVDDKWGKLLAERLGKCCWRASLNQENFQSGKAELFIKEINMQESGVSGLLVSPHGEGCFHSPLVGSFNLMNILQATGVLLQQGLPLKLLLEKVSEFSGVPGRMEKIVPDSLNVSKIPKVFVDYAHTPDGLKNALLSLRPIAKRDIICVFGCGGDRDRLKRPLMGSIAADYADTVFVTSDNPRTEDPRHILDDVLRGIPSGKKIEVEEDREVAITKAIELAKPTDLVLIAGKGHEDYQIIGKKKIDFDDRKIAMKALKNKVKS